MNEGSEFDDLVDRVEEIMCNLGTPYRNGVGDFLIVQDDYGINEVSIILCKSLPIETFISEIQACIKQYAPGWKIRIGGNKGVDWNGDRDLVINASTTWSEARPN